MAEQGRRPPDWELLYNVAEAQRGYFRASQAADAGYSPQLLNKYVRNGRILRARRGVYRLVHFPASENEDLMELWLWSDRIGAFSFETALALYGLTDAMPARVHMTVPSAWEQRNLVVPDGLALHYADLSDHDRQWVGAVQVTTPTRTLRDVLDYGEDPAAVTQAVRDGVARNLLSPEDARDLTRWTKPRSRGRRIRGSESAISLRNQVAESRKDKAELHFRARSDLTKPAAPTAPDWRALFQVAANQGGLFRADQATAAGFSPQLLRSHVLAGRLERTRRGIYRVAHFPTVENDELMELWLWSERLGVFSHETALVLHELSDAMPSRAHMTVPRSWARRRLSPPELLILHYADVPVSDRTWLGLIPVTTPTRTLRDAVDANVDPDLIEQAVADGRARRLFRRVDLRGIAPLRRIG
jgi:predicted transcriptional regulator of viral defense system